TDGMHFRFWNGTWDIAGGVTADASLVKINTWVRVSYVQTATHQLIYIDGQLAGQSSGTRTLYAGDIRLGAYNTNGYFYPGEYTDIKIFDQALTAEQIGEMVDQDGVETQFSSLTTGSDLGGIWKREEHGGVYDTIITSENGLIKHWFNGDSCWGAVSKLIPSGNSSLWFSGEFFYPSALTANHDFGSTAQTIGIYEDTGRSNPIAILYLDHDEISNVLTLGRISYRNSMNGTTTVTLDGREIQKDVFHQFELYYDQAATGNLAFYLNGEELINVNDDFDLEVEQAMFGLNLGIHPQMPGDHIFSKNIYAGVQRAAAQVIIPEPVHHFPMQEGSGVTIMDSITGTQLSGVDTTVDWQQADIKGMSDKWYVKSGPDSGSQGVIQGVLIQENLNEYTFSFLTRIVDETSGAIFNSLTDGLHFRFWYGSWDIAGGLSSGSAYVQLNTWVRVTYVQSATHQSIYIDDQMAGHALGHRTMYAGGIRLGGYGTTSYFYPGEYTDVRFYDQALTAEQIELLNQQDG
ncbi:MAG: LamG domain-containing protein, partial [Desulfobacteraceae bacterium]|nr:LamG domain-containing protein [Desulfobacteraceae bacterium]